MSTIRSFITGPLLFFRFALNRLGVKFSRGLTVRRENLESHIDRLCFGCKKDLYRIWIDCDECDDSFFCSSHGCGITLAVESCLRNHKTRRIIHFQNSESQTFIMNEFQFIEWCPKIKVLGHLKLISISMEGNSILGDVKNPNNWLHMVETLPYKSLVVILIYHGESWEKYLESFEDDTSDVLIMTTTEKQLLNDLGVALSNENLFK